MIENRNTQDPFDYSGRKYNPRSIPVRPPKDIRVERQGSTISVWVKDRDWAAARGGASGADRYDIYWAEDVDNTTKDGLDAGAARATKVGEVSRVFVEEKELLVEIANGKFQNGFFYGFGANVDGDRSVDYVVSSRQTAEVLDDTIPAPVTGFEASESGEQHNGTVVSAIAWKYFAPLSLSFGGVQFIAEDYPNRGEVTYLSPDIYRGAPGGMSTGKIPLVPARRVGLGTVTTTAASANITITGGKPTLQFAAGDVIEILGVQGIVQTVSESVPQIVLTANWGGKIVTTFAEYWAIGKIRLYAAALSKAGTHGDYTKAPFVDLVLDAELSDPVAPSIDGTALGNTNEIVVTPAAGTAIDYITLYRGKNAGLAASDCLPIFVWRKENHNLSGVLRYPDTNFSLFDREQGQVYSYFAAATNARGKEGTFSSRKEVACRLNAPGDGTPTIPAGSNPRNLLYNSYINGTIGNTVDNADASQDTYAGGAPAGFHRWHSSATGGATRPGHQTVTDVVMPAPGAGNEAVLKQLVDAWDNATTANRRIELGPNIMFAIYATTSGGSPNGTLELEIEMMNGGAGTGTFYQVKKRISDDTYDYGDAKFVIQGSDVASTQVYYAVFSPAAPPATVTQLEFRVRLKDSNNGVNVYVTHAMACYGDELAAWTPEMVASIFPKGTHIGAFPDHDGNRRGFTRMV